MSRYGVLLLALGVLALAGCKSGPATTQPSNATKAPPQFRVTPVQVKDVPRIAFLFERTTTTYAEMNKAIDAIVPELEKTEKTHAPIGPYLFVFRSSGDDPTRPFVLDIGYPVKEGTRATGRFRVRYLDPFRCASTEYTGPMGAIDRAYAHIYEALARTGASATYEAREVYLKWVGPNSPDNVTEVQVGVRQ